MSMIERVLVAALLAGTGLTACAVDGRPDTVAQSEDARITTRVQARFAGDAALAGTRVQVQTLQGVVQLTGYAATEAERQRAAQLAATVPGVRQVVNGVAVRAPQG